MHIILPRSYVHFVWATFDRRPLISSVIEAPLHALLADRCTRLGAIPLAIGGMSEHIHALVALPSSLSIAKLLGDIKGASAYAINHEFGPHQGFRWQRGYATFSVSPFGVPAVIRYIAQQKIHHAKGAPGNPDMEIATRFPLTAP